MTMNKVPQNEQNGQDGPTLDQQYVALPGHPFYGRSVQVVGRRVSRTYTRCIIEDPAHPGFHYHIFERWLSISPPPPEPNVVTAQTPIAISLVALDNLVHNVPEPSTVVLCALALLLLTGWCFRIYTKPAIKSASRLGFGADSK